MSRLTDDAQKARLLDLHAGRDSDLICHWIVRGNLIRAAAELHVGSFSGMQEYARGFAAGLLQAARRKRESVRAMLADIENIKSEKPS